MTDAVNIFNMRFFLAFDLPENIKKEAEKIQEELKILNIEAKWVKSENFHLTVAFLGSINKEAVSPLKKILASINRLIETPINLRLGKLSGFPRASKARVIFVDLIGEIKRLEDLVVNVRSRLKEGKIWLDEKPFVPHLTLGRFKKPKNISRLTEKFVIKKIPFEIKKISLYQSRLFPSGAIYKKI